MPETTDYSQMNIWKKIAKIRSLVEVVQKNKRNSNNSYADEEQILLKVTAGLETYGLVCYPEIVPTSVVVEKRDYEKTKVVNNKETKQDEIRVEKLQDFVAKGDLVYTWVNADNPSEQIRVPWSFVGQQRDPSFAFGGGLTYANRYFFLKFFNASTTDEDPEAWVDKKKDASATIVDEMLDEIDEKVKVILEKDSSLAPQVKIAIRQYVVDDKGKQTEDYFQITDVKTAQKVLSELSKIKKDKKEKKE